MLITKNNDLYDRIIEYVIGNISKTDIIISNIIDLGIIPLNINML